MKQKQYLKSPPKDKVFRSSIQVYKCLYMSGFLPTSLPVPGIAQRPEDKNDEYFFVWKTETEEGICILPFFDEPNVKPDVIMTTFQPIEPGEFFLYQGQLYEVKLNKRYGFYLQNVFFRYKEFYANVEAELRGYSNAEFELCRLYVIGRTRKQIGVCWVGYVEETGEIMLIKLFEEDNAIFAAYDPNELTWEAIGVGEVFKAHERLWALRCDKDGRYFVDDNIFRRDAKKSRLSSDKNVGKDGCKIIPLGR